MPGRPSDLDYSRQGPAALAVGAGGVVRHFFSYLFFSHLFLPLSG